MKISVQKQVKKYLDFIIYSHIWISLCAVMLSYHSFYYFDAIYDNLLFTPFLLLAFCSTLTFYNIHWAWKQYIIPNQEKTFWCIQYKMYLRILAIVFLFCTVFIMLKYFFFLWQWFLLPFVLAFWYILKKYRIWKISFFPKTFLVAFTWSYLFVFIPLTISMSEEAPSLFNCRQIIQNVFFLLSNFFYMYCITFFFDLRDKKDDKKNNIFHLITFLSSKKVWIVFYLSLVLYFATSVLYSFVYEKNLFEFSLVSISAIILFLLSFFPLAKRHDYWFYFFLDGMIALSGFAVFFL